MTEDLKYEGGNFKIMMEGNLQIKWRRMQNTDCDWYITPDPWI